MSFELLKKLTLPVLVMLFVYYAHNPASSGKGDINTVNSINEQLSVSNLQVTDETHHVVYALHEWDYIVRTYVPKDLDLCAIESIFMGLTGNFQQVTDDITSLVPENARLLSYELTDGYLTLNLSAEFLEYDLSQEQQLLSALVWTFTELDEVDRVGFKIEGEPVANLKGTLAVGSGLTRSMGLNLEIDMDLSHLNDAKQVTLFFLTDDSSDAFLIPVTRLIPAKEDTITYVIESLITGPVGQNYISVFNHRTTLIDDPILENGLLTLNFSSDLYYNRAQTEVSSAMLRQLVMTLTDLDEVDQISVIIEGSVKVFDDELGLGTITTSDFAVDSFIEAQ